MSDSDDPFVRKKRTSKPAKRRRRPERRLFDDESDTDVGGEGPAIGRRTERTKAVRNPNPRVSFGFPKDLHKEKEPSDEDGDSEDEPRPDYSAAGLQRLRDLTFKEPPPIVSEPVVEKPPLSPPPLTASKRAESSVRKEVIDVDAEPMDICARPPVRPSERDAEIGAKKHSDGGVGFLSLDRERTDEKLGVLCGDDIDAMELDVTGNDRSGAEEWELEQLRRAGLNLGGANVADHEARGIVEDEDLTLPLEGSGGEIGHTAVDTFLESIEEAIHSTKYKMVQCAKKLEEVRKSRVEIEGEPFVIEAVHLPEPPPPPPAPLSPQPPPPPLTPPPLMPPLKPQAQLLPDLVPPPPFGMP